MHRQIGNAVPIPLAQALGREFRKSLFQRWKTQREEAIVIPDEDDDNHPQQNLQPPLNVDEDDSMDDFYV
jgi:hypothetical protein